MLARRRNNEDVSEMATALGRLIRSAVEQDRSLIRLGEELETAESYFRIQKCAMVPGRRLCSISKKGWKIAWSRSRRFSRSLRMRLCTGLETASKGNGIRYGGAI